MVKIVFLTREGCANTPTMRANLDKALHDLGGTQSYQIIDAATLQEKDTRRSYGTPTILVEDNDLFGRPRPQNITGLT